MRPGKSVCQKTILIYGVTGMQLLALLSKAQQAGIRCKAVSDRQTLLTVSQLLSDKEFPAGPPMPLNGRFALLDGFGGHEDEAINLINSVAGGVIKSVHTQHNSGWRFADLCAELHLEHKTLNRP